MNCLTIMLLVCKLSFLSVLFAFASTQSGVLKKCPDGDKDCMIKTANSVYQQFMKGIPELGIEPHEPMHHALIEGHLGTLYYKLINATFVGMDRCTFRDVDFKEATMKLHVQMSCPKVDLASNYEISGSLLMIPVHGEGTNTVVTGEYNFVIDCDVKMTTGADGKPRLNIKNYKVESHATAPIVFDFKNLFNGQKDLSDAMHKFANENWAEVADYVEDPIWYQHAKELITTANKYMKAYPLE